MSTISSIQFGSADLVIFKKKDMPFLTKMAFLRNEEPPIGELAIYIGENSARSLPFSESDPFITSFRWPSKPRILMGNIPVHVFFTNKHVKAEKENMYAKYFPPSGELGATYRLDKGLVYDKPEGLWVVEVKPKYKKQPEWQIKLIKFLPFLFQGLALDDKHYSQIISTQYYPNLENLNGNAFIEKIESSIKLTA